MPATKRKFAAPVGLLINSISTVDSSVASTTPSSGAFVITGGVGIGGTANITGSVNLWNSANTYYTGLRAGTLTTSTFYILPTNFPGTGTSVLQSNTSGTLSWVPMTASGSGSGTTSANINVVAAGINTSHPILFTPTAGTQSGVAVSSKATFVYNPSTDILSVSGLAVTAATGSSNTTSGALVITGGVGIGGSLNVSNKARFADEVTLTSISSNALSILGSGSVSYTWSVGTTLSSSRYNLGLDLCLVPIGGSQSAIQTYWGMQLVGNNQNAANTYSPSAIGARDAFGVLIPNQQPASVGLAVIANASQTADLQIWTTPSGLATTTYLAVKSNGQLYSYASIASTNTTTGALVVTGGVGIGDSLNVAGNVSINSGTNGLSFRKLVAGNFGAVYSTNIAPSTTNYSFITDGASASLNGTNGVYLNISNTNKIQVTANNINIVPTVDSTSTSTGAFTVAGGVGIGGSLYVGGQNRFSGARNSTSTTSGTVVIDGGLGITGNAFIGNTVNIAGQTLITSSLGSTNNVTGALVVTGGLGVSGQLSFVAASMGFTGITYNPTMAFIGNTSASPITLSVLTDNSLSWEGTSGQLFAIDNNLTSGDIFSVSDISGLPIISASAGQTVSLNEFGGFTRVGNGLISSTGASALGANGSLVVYGGVGITGNAFIGGTTFITNTQGSTGTSNGALVVNGGLGIVGNANIGGSVTLSNSTTSTSTTSGTLIVSGGVGIGGSVYIGGQSRFSGARDSTSTTSGTLVIDGGLGITGSAFIGGTFYSTSTGFFNNSTTSTSTTTGALIISGGVGIGGSVFIGGQSRLSGARNSTSTTSGTLVIDGGVGITGNAFIGGTANISGQTVLSSATNASNSTSGALVVSGGVGIGQSLIVGGNLHFSGQMRGGNNTFTKTTGSGDINLDNGTADTPGVLYYWQNNRNIGTDVFFSGSGTTRYRIVKELNETGGAELWSIDREGIVYRSAYAVGETINTAMYNYSDLNMASTTTISSTSYTTFATVTYTPKSSSSYLWIEFSATYTVAGTSADDHWSNIEVNGSEIVNSNQVWTNATGGGTRSGVLFPLAARYTNTGTAGIAISVRAKRGTSDDNNTIYGNNASGFMRIQEIGR